VTVRAQPNTTELAVLGLIAFEERSGYDLARLAQQSVGYLWTPSRSQIYKVLPRLVDRGLATVRGVPQVDRPDKAVYRITPAGRRAIRAWLEQVDVEPAADTNVFALKLFFGDLVPTPVVRAQLDGYRDFLEQRLRRFESMRRDTAGGEPIFPQLVLRRAIVRIQATLVWIEEATRALPAHHGGS
jgi:PadR family transcriptional regulator AphA